MTSILERLDDLIRGSLHRFVDRALGQNSLTLYDQDVRDMEAAIDHLEEATTTMYAAARANERRLVRHREDIQRVELRLERFAVEGVAPTSERIMVAEAELKAKQDLAATTQAQIDRQQAQYETLAKRQADVALRARSLKDARPRLESLLVLARAYRSVEQVQLTLEGLRGLGGETEVAMLAESIHAQLNEAQARLAMLDQVEDLEMLAELQHIELEDQLAKRRRRLGLVPEHEGADPPPDAVPPESPTAGPTPDEPESPADPPPAPQPSNG